MCTGAEFMAGGSMFSGAQVQAGGSALGGLSQLLYAQTQMEMAKADAASGRDAAQQQAQRIMRETQRRRGEARAATAASGAALDASALSVEQEILQAGETDAAMTILGAERQARTGIAAAKMQRAAALSEAGGSLFKAAYGLSGWRGTKGSDYSATGADILARR